MVLSALRENGAVLADVPRWKSWRARLAPRFWHEKLKCIRTLIGCTTLE
jgi:hypothetical protein